MFYHKRGNTSFKLALEKSKTQMTCLFKHVRVHQIFGANTNVGKTILSTALVRVSAQLGKKVFYLKPVSTGALGDADDL